MDPSIRCSICLDVLVEAIVLRCGHSFCELCLDEAVNVDDRCPECRRHTHGVLISNLRLNDCIHHIMKEDSRKFAEFNRRKARNKALMGLRREARAVTYSILHKIEKPLTLQEIEDEWMTTRRLPSFPDVLRAELHRTILSSPSIFQMIEQNNERRVKLTNFGNEEVVEN
uniref:RING-type domain-containing protein n=1 Tax=Haemonchus contortus TaxID=6289 RepID=A0A7I4YBG2_HAECO